MRRWFCFLDKEKMLAHRIEVRCASTTIFGAMLVITAAALFGCDSTSWVPPQPEELRETASSIPIPLKDASPDPALVELASARSVEIVLAPREGDEAEFWKSAARTQSGHEKIKVKIAITGADQPRTKQLELVREAMARHPRVLIVEPVDPADVELAQAVTETRAQGIPVVLLGMPLTSDKSAAAGSSASTTAPLVVVAPPPFSSSARELVAAAIRNAKAAELDPNGGAIIVINSIGDRFIPDRVAAFREALKTAGITPVEEIRFDNEAAAGEKLVRASLKAHPKCILLFTVDYMSTSSIRSLLSGGGSFRPASNDSSKDEIPFVVAGCYTGDTNVQDIGMQPAVAAVVDFTPVRLLRKAIVTAVSLSQGKVISSPVELPLAVEDRPHHAARLRAAVANAKKPVDAK